MRSTIGATGSGERRAGHDPRRPRRLDAGQPRARIRLARVGGARDRSLVLMRRTPNVEGWTRANKEYTDARAESAWAEDEISWGIWQVPERELKALPRADRQGRRRARVGTAFSVRVARGASSARASSASIRPGPGHLTMARHSEEKSATGASSSRRSARTSRCPTRRSTSSSPSTARRSGPTRTSGFPRQPGSCGPAASSSFSGTRRSSLLCAPLDDEEARRVRRCRRPSSGCSEFQWPNSGIEYHLAHGDWIRLLRANGFEILDLIEIQAPANASTHEHYAYVTADWGPEVAGGGDLASPPANSFRNDRALTGCDGRVRGKDAGA